MKPGFLSIISMIVVLLSLSPVLALKETTTYLPAVQETDYGYEGTLATLTVNIKEGNGHVYVDTWPLAKIDTQASARIAKKVSCDLLYLDCSNYDFFYTIRSDAQIVGGPSGGGAMTVATLASLLDLNISSRVLMTGTINLDGSIGQVSGILEKLDAVAEKGDTFLIPYRQHIIKTEETKIDVNSINITKTEQMNVIEYAKEHFNLTVKEVKTVKEAFRHFTNYEIKDPEVKFKRTQEFQQIMKKLGGELINHSAELKETCEEELKNAKINYKYQNQVFELCSLSLNKAEDSYKKENYYSGASFAFSRSISYRYGINLIKLLKEEDKKTFLFNYLKNIENKIFDVNTSNIELYAITEGRISEVQENLEQAWKNYYNGDYIQGIYYGSYGDERLYTAKLWNRHEDQFPANIKEIPHELKDIANEIISDTHSIIIYSSLNSPNSFLDKSRDFLNRAEEDYKKENYYASIIFGLKSEANAELASESLSKDSDYLMELHRKKALVLINKTNSVIGQSYFEYAETLSKDDKQTSLIYYTYAEKLSGLDRILNKRVEMIGIEPNEYIKPVGCDYKDYIPIFLISITICFFTGLIIGKL